ncbi:MAG: aryl-sulfate sulfotransferase [Bacteroidota bacterium]
MRFNLTSRSAILFMLLFALFFKPGKAQTGILLNTEEAMPSYTLYESVPWVYLVDNCGKLINSWNTGSISFHPKLLPNGHLVYISNRFTVRELDWDGSLVNEVSHDDLDLSIEYEVILLPNQNYLCVARRDFSQQEFLDLGFDYGTRGTPNVTDGVVELDRETGDIIWEWNIRDHVIQQRDSTVGNYGILTEHPELLNLDGIGTFDWTWHESFMINSMDYNPQLDQITISVRKMSEIAIIDHSTTTEEAAGHTGGNSGKGGDILYRWGNPQNYGRGTVDDRQLFFQHNPNWITQGPYSGYLTVYDNGLNRPGVSTADRYSSVPIIETPVDDQGNYPLVEGEAYGPALPTVRYSDIETGTRFYSSYTSGAEVLPNGNIFITEGVDGRLLEINPDGEVVWSYTVPFVSYIYRTEKYPLDYPAFEGRDLTPTGTAPNTNSTYECDLVSNTEELTSAASFSLRYFPAEQMVRLRNHAEHGLEWALYNTQGQLVQQGRSDFAQLEVDVAALAKGMYVFELRDTISQLRQAKKMIKL